MHDHRSGIVATYSHRLSPADDYGAGVPVSNLGMTQAATQTSFSNGCRR